MSKQLGKTADMQLFSHYLNVDYLLPHKRVGLIDGRDDSGPP